jgi:hypothetical protein
MAIYLSAGTATIAALMIVDQADKDEQLLTATVPKDSRFLRAEVDAFVDPGAGFDMDQDFSQIGRRCERAVVTAYRDLRTHGTGDLSAFQACTTLYRIHHPEASLSEARSLVAEWIDHHVVQCEAGQTNGCDCDN